MRNCSRPKYGRQKHRVRERSCFYAGKTHSQVSLFLQEAYPGNKGFSSWSVRRFCLKNGLHAEYQTCQIKRWITVRMKLLLGWVFLLEFFLLICTFFYCRLVFIACSLSYGVHQSFKCRGRKGTKWRKD